MQTIKVFVCLCFPHLRSYRTHKISFRSEPCFFIGYYSTHHGYKYLSSSGRVYVSRNVVFDETKFPFEYTKGDFFGSLSPKSVTPSKPFFIPCDPQLQSSKPSDVSPDVPTSHDSTPLFTLPSSPSLGNTNEGVIPPVLLFESGSAFSETTLVPVSQDVSASTSPLPSHSCYVSSLVQNPSVSALTPIQTSAPMSTHPTLIKSKSASLFPPSLSLLFLLVLIP